MKTLPIINLSQYDHNSILLREYIRRDSRKLNGILLITPPSQKQETVELISEKENAEILEKLKKFNKEIFGKK